MTTVPAENALSLLLQLTSQQIFLVGGSVRDLLLKTPDIRDIDLLMATGSEDVARSFAKHINGSFFFIDEERRISRVVQRGEDRTLQFDFTNFEGPDLAADLGRRDFTINAMAIDLRSFMRSRTLDGLIDPFDGREDLKSRLIRATRPSVLDDDPLRLLRAARFAATLGFTIEQKTVDEIRQRAELIRKPSPERVRDELFLILAGPGAGGDLMLMDSLGLLLPLFPELAPLRGFAPGRYHVHDVLTHSIKTADYLDAVLDGLRQYIPHHCPAVIAHLNEMLEQNVTRFAALRFACLIHDNAKPETYTNTDGHVRFHGHDNLGADKAVNICGRFRLSRETEKMIVRVIRQHMRLFNLSGPAGPSRNALYRYCRDLGDAVPEGLLLSQADARATFEIMPKEKFTDTSAVMATVLEYYYSKFLKVEAAPLVTGNDLIERGLSPGPKFREILEEIKEKQAEGAIRDRGEALEYLETLAEK